MKKYGFFVLLLIAVVVFAFAPAWACEGPGCDIVNDKIKIIAVEHSFQDGDSVLVGNNLSSVFKQVEVHNATGERYVPDATGGVALNSAQYYNVSESKSLPNGGSSEHYFNGFQGMNNAAEIGGNCPTLNVDSANKYTAVVNTDQGANSMSGLILAKDRGHLNLSGAPGSLSGNLVGEHNTGYSNTGPSGQQFGNVYTHIQINHTSPVPQ